MKRAAVCALVWSWLIIVAVPPARAALVNFGTIAADPNTWGTNVFLDAIPAQYGSLGLSRTPLFQQVTSVSDTRTDSIGTRAGRALLTPSNFDLGVLATTSRASSVVEAAAVAATGYFVFGVPVQSIPATITIQGDVRGTANLGGLLLELFIKDYHDILSPRDTTIFHTSVELDVDTQSTLGGTRPPLTTRKIACFFRTEQFITDPSTGQQLNPCQLDVSEDRDYGFFSVTIPFSVVPTSGNGIVAELFAQAFSSTGEEETMDFLATASLAFTPPDGVTVMLATGQTFGTSPDTIPPTTTAIPSPSPNSNGWNNTNVTVALTATDDPGGSGVKEIHFSESGAQGGAGVVAGSSAPVTISAEGTTTLTFFAVDNAGNPGAAKTLTVRIDKTPPIIAGLPAVGCMLGPPDHRLLQVGTVTASDNLSGLAPGSLTVTGTSNEAVNRLGDGNTAPDIVISGTTVQLRAERSGEGTGRIYTLTASATDLAGNRATVIATCTVPHHQRYTGQR